MLQRLMILQILLLTFAYALKERVLNLMKLIEGKVKSLYKKVT